VWKSRGIGNGFRPHLVCHIARILPEAHRHADAVVSQMLQLIHKSIPSDRQMLVGVDDRRHDGLASQIHTSRARRNLQVSLSPDGGEPTVLNNECGIRDRRALVSDNEPPLRTPSLPLAAAPRPPPALSNLSPRKE
jgi:hypothetical protein